MSADTSAGLATTLEKGGQIAAVIVAVTGRSGLSTCPNKPL